MKEHPLLLNGESVRSVLAGLKTQIRTPIMQIEQWMIEYDGDGAYTIPRHDDPNDHVNILYYSPWRVGDRLWVRETFCEESAGWSGLCTYRADLPMHWDAGETTHGEAVTLRAEDYTWKPSIHMPRWASRITLEVTGVRVERVQEISHEEAIAEGFTGRNWKAGSQGDTAYPCHAYRDWWDSMYKKRGFGWDTNPVVWVREFKLCKEKE